MKELSFERMEEVKGGVSCFFAIPNLFLACYNITWSWATGWLDNSVAKVYQCWNN